MPADIMSRDIATRADGFAATFTFIATATATFATFFLFATFSAAATAEICIFVVGRTSATTAFTMGVTSSTAAFTSTEIATSMSKILNFDRCRDASCLVITVYSCALLALCEEKKLFFLCAETLC